MLHLRKLVSSSSSKLREFFSFDYRSLALMRICVGGILVCDLIERARSLTAHYTDAGVLSRADVLTLAGNKFFVSLHMISGLGTVQALLFLTAGVFALMLMAGYRTRLAVIASWFLLISLHARNPMVLQGGDVVLRVILFWMLFLPIGRRWSLDRFFGRVARVREQAVFSVATVAYVVQVVLIYAFSGFLKTGAVWHDGTAVYYALSIDQLVTPLGKFLLKFPWLDRLLTHATLLAERYGSLLYFSPVATGLVRTLGVCLFAALQIGFNLSMHLGLFGAISIAATLGLLPPYFWDSWTRHIAGYFKSKAQRGLSLYYDGDCGFCFKSAHLVKRLLLLNTATHLEPAGTDPEISRAMTEKNSWVVVDEHGVFHFGFRGLITALQYSPIFSWCAPILSLPIIKDVGEYFYQKIARGRSLVCLPEQAETPSAGRPSRIFRKIKNGVLIFLIVYVFFWNIGTVGTTAVIPQNWKWVAWTTRLDQSFNMFAPAPLVEDGWYVIPATLRDGSQIDLFRNGPMIEHDFRIPVSYEKPQTGSIYPDQRWQKYLMNIAEQDNAKYREGYGKYLCRTWNGRHTGGDTLMSFQIIFVLEKTPPLGTPAATPPSPITLWNHQCFASSDTLPPPPEHIAFPVTRPLPKQ